MLVQGLINVTFPTHAGKKVSLLLSKYSCRDFIEKLFASVIAMRSGLSSKPKLSIFMIRSKLFFWMPCDFFHFLLQFSCLVLLQRLLLLLLRRKLRLWFISHIPSSTIRKIVFALLALRRANCVNMTICINERRHSIQAHTVFWMKTPKVWPAVFIPFTFARCPYIKCNKGLSKQCVGRATSLVGGFRTTYTSFLPLPFGSFMLMKKKCDENIVQHMLDTMAKWKKKKKKKLDFLGLGALCPESSPGKCFMSKKNIQKRRAKIWNFNDSRLVERNEGPSESFGHFFHSLF